MFFQQHLPTTSPVLFRNVFFTFWWLCLGLVCSIISQLLVACQAQRYTYLAATAQSVFMGCIFTRSLMAALWICQITNLSSFLSVAWTAAVWGIAGYCCLNSCLCWSRHYRFQETLHSKDHYSDGLWYRANISLLLLLSHALSSCSVMSSCHMRPGSLLLGLCLPSASGNSGSFM